MLAMAMALPSPHDKTIVILLGEDKRPRDETDLFAFHVSGVTTRASVLDIVRLLTQRNVFLSGFLGHSYGSQ